MDVPEDAPPVAGEASEWSVVYRLAQPSRDALFLKGVPRSRAEPRVSARIADLCPDAVPAVVGVDLVPDAAWCWFALRDAGEVAGASIDPRTAACAARVLGMLQTRCAFDRSLAATLPRCAADGLWEALQGCAGWAAEVACGDSVAQVGEIRRRLPRAEGFVRRVGTELQRLPSMLIHGDFWAGNIAIGDDATRLLDWGDALWGIGGVSVVNLIASQDGTLDDCTAEVWAAYEAGLGRIVPSRYREACSFAHYVAGLVVDREIAKCCERRLDRLPGYLPALARILEVAHA